MRPDHLSDAHYRMLREGSAICDDVMRDRGYRTVTEVAELRSLGFEPQQCRVPALVIPLWTTDGETAYHVLRSDRPRVFDDKNHPLGDGTFKQKVLKYEMPKGCAVRLDCPPPCLPALADPSLPLWITEGQKKADALASAGLTSIALLGVWNWRGRNPLGGLTALADWERIALNGRQVVIAFDSDVTTKPEVRQALERLTRFLQNKNAHVDVLYLPKGDSGKTGVDDYLAQGHTAGDLIDLLDRPRPVPQAALPVAKLLAGAPPELNRPLQVIEHEGKPHGFAATWLYVEVTRTETVDNRGNVVRHNPPKVTKERHLFAVRDDGRIYGEQAWNGVKSFDEVGLSARLPEIPPESRQWSVDGTQRYLRRERPDPLDVHRRISETFNRFIDFDRSLTGGAGLTQETMCDMAACYVMASYLLDAFTVTGYLWPTGERGSGKTQFLTLVAELGYLGTLLQMGGSFASLRDLSDYGALLCFDDAENLADPKADPDKRTLLLAGNRKGTHVTVKEPVSERGWQTRHVRTFTPRCFSAISAPDPVLASRSILAPLVRTSDRGRANADALEYRLWPHDRRRLIDDLWAVGLAHMTELGQYEMRVNDEADLLGRSLEPWRTILAVAAWLDDLAQVGNLRYGLYDRMTELAQAYQEERKGLEREDLTTLVIEAVKSVTDRRTGDISDISDISDIKNERRIDVLCVSSSEVTEEVHRLMEERESELERDRVVPKRIGRILGKLRFQQEHTNKARRWTITQRGLDNLLLAYGLTKQRDECQESDVTDVTDVTNVTAELPFQFKDPLQVGDFLAQCPPEPPQAKARATAEDFHEEREDILPLWKWPKGPIPVNLPAEDDPFRDCPNPWWDEDVPAWVN